MAVNLGILNRRSDHSSQAKSWDRAATLEVKSILEENGLPLIQSMGGKEKQGQACSLTINRDDYG